MNSKEFVYWMPTLRENLSLSVYYTGFENCSPGYEFSAVRDHYVIHVITSGVGYVEVSPGNFETLTAGDAFLISPMKTVTYRADQQDPWRYEWVGFSGTEAERLISLTDFHKSPIFHLPETNSLLKLLGDVRKVVGNTAADEALRTGKLYAFFSKLMKLSETNQSVGRFGVDHMEKAVTFVMNNYSRHIDVSAIADYVGISRSHLYRLFMKRAGISPNEYLTRVRINQACALLRDASLTVRQVAHSVGFSDQLYFSRVFHKFKHVAPSNYLKEAYASDSALLLECHSKKETKQKNSETSL